MKNILSGLFLVAMPSLAATQSGSLIDSFSRTSVTASDHAIFSNAKDDTASEQTTKNSLLNEAKVRVENGALSGNIHFTNKYLMNAPQSSQKYFTLEKKTVALETSNWDIKLGDSHQELGRGIALSLYSEPAFGIDNTLEGGAVKYHPKEFAVGVFAGRVNALKSPVAINPFDMLMQNRDVYLGAVSTQVNVGPEAKVGGHYLLSMNQRLENHTFNKRQQTAGLFYQQENVIEAVDLYAETDMMVTDKLTPTTSKTEPLANASYASLTWSPQPWKTRLEYKNYNKFNYDFRRPPSLEEDVPLNFVENNYTDIIAMKLYGERRLEDSGIRIYSSFLGGQDRIEDAKIYHAVVGSKIPVSRTLEFELKGGHRWLPSHNNISHGSLKTKLKTFKGQMVELELKKQLSHLQLNNLPSTDDRNIAGLTYTFTEKFNVSTGFEWVPTNDIETGKTFLNAGASYKSGPLTSRAFVGQTSGGTQCAGGVCRTVPPYSGAMLEATYAF